MSVYNDFAGVAASTKTVSARDHLSPFAAAQPDAQQLKAHNARGLILAVAMSAACWAGIGVAFFL